MEVAELDPDDLTLPDPDTEPKPATHARSPLEQDSITPVSWKPTHAEPIPVVRCSGTVKNGVRAGERCGKWAVRGSTVCRSHGAQLPLVREHAKEVVENARLRLIGMADDAVDALEDLVAFGTQDQIRLAAAKEILDRSGVTKTAPDMNVTVEHKVSAADAVAEKLKMIASRINADDSKAEPEDLGEVVDEDD